MPGIVSGHVEVVTIALQMLISLATIGLVYRLAWNLTAKGSAAVAAAGFFAIEPLSIIYTSYLMPETVFTFLLVLFLLALTRYLDADALLPLVAAALLLVAATLTRPVSYYLPAGITALLIVRALCAAPRFDLRRLAQAGVFLVVCAVPLAGWQTRNYLAAGYSGFSAISDWNMYFFQGASVLAHEQAKPLEQVQLELGSCDLAIFDAAHPGLRERGEAAKFNYLGKEGKRLVKEHVAAYAVIHARGMARLMLNPAATDALRLLSRYWENQRTLKPIDLGLLGIVRGMAREVPHVLIGNLVLGVVLGAIYCSAALGIVSGLRRLSWQLTFLAATASYFVIVSGGPTCVARLRQPVMPLVCVIGGLGVAEAVRWLVARKRERSMSDQDQVALSPSQTA
jgi:4-amino-4-deoxy-L-arabinose transferase-like glycosyltransferase